MESVFSVGMLIAYLAYKDQFSQRVGALIDKWVELRMLRLHGERLSDIVVTEPESSSLRSGGLPLMICVSRPMDLAFAMLLVSRGYSGTAAW